MKEIIQEGRIQLKEIIQGGRGYDSVEGDYTGE